VREFRRQFSVCYLITKISRMLSLQKVLTILDPPAFWRFFIRSRCSPSWSDLLPTSANSPSELHHRLVWYSLSSTAAPTAPLRLTIPIALPQLQTATSFCALLHSVLDLIFVVSNSISTFPVSSVILDFMRTPPSPPLAAHFRIDVHGTSQILLPHMAADRATRCFLFVAPWYTALRWKSFMRTS
jgi:hypothetical protein